MNDTIRVGFGDSMRVTLQTLIIMLRMRLSEPTEGLWGIVEYTDDELEVDELSFLLNEAQVYVCRDLYERGFAFFESEVKLSVKPGETQYVLPADFMAPQSIFQFRGDESCKLSPGVIKSLEEMFPQGRKRYQTNGYYSHYEVRGNEASPEPAFETQISIPYDDDDYPNRMLTDDDVEEAGIDVGDTLYNVMDGSSGRITDISVWDDNNDYWVIEVNGLSGGRTDTFELLDYITVQNPRQPYEVLNVYPPVHKISENEVHNGLPTFYVADYVTADRLLFAISKTPEGIHPIRDRVYISIVDDDGETIASGGVTAPLNTQNNKVEFGGRVYLEPEVKYHIVGANPTFVDNAISMENSFQPESVQVYGNNREDYIRLKYTRMPTPMTKMTSICEFPPYLHPPVIAAASVIAEQKKSGQIVVDLTLSSIYNEEIAKALSFLNKRGESGPYNVFKDNPRNRTKRYTSNGVLIPDGYTDTVIF